MLFFNVNLPQGICLEGELKPTEGELLTYVDTLGREKRRFLRETSHERISDNVRQSLFQGLTLQQYYFALQKHCQVNHTDKCDKCSIFLLATSEILTKTFVSLAVLWRKAKFSLKYDCEKAQRWILRMPVAVLRINESVATRLYVTEKLNDSFAYDVIIKQIKAVSHDHSATVPCLKKKEFEELLSIIADETERERMKHAVAKVHNSSRRVAANFYGISRCSKRATKVAEAIRITEAITRKNNALCINEQKSYLSLMGLKASDLSDKFNIPDELLDSKASDSDFDFEEDHHEEDASATEDARTEIATTEEVEGCKNCGATTSTSEVETNVYAQPI